MTTCQRSFAFACISLLTTACRMGAMRILPSKATGKSVNDRVVCSILAFIQEGHLGTECVHM